MSDGTGQDRNWPYAVMQDLAAYLQANNMHRTAEMLDDARLLFVEEQQRVARVKTVHLHVVQDAKG